MTATVLVAAKACPDTPIQDSPPAPAPNGLASASGSVAGAHRTLTFDRRALGAAVRCLPVAVLISQVRRAI
jgi:hypothetical protein